MSEQTRGSVKTCICTSLETSARLCSRNYPSMAVTICDAQWLTAIAVRVDRTSFW